MLVLASYFIGGDAQWIHWHALAGLSAGFLLVFRLVWGVIGPLYSRFFHFAFTPVMAGRLTSKNVLEKNDGAKSTYPGHTLEASWVMVAIYFVLFVVVMSGFLAYAGEEVAISAFQTGLRTADVAANIHQGALPALWILIVIHLIGVVLSAIDDRETGIFGSMISGYKNVTAVSASLSDVQRWFAVLSTIFFLIFTLLFGYKAMTAESPAASSTEINLTNDHD